MPKIDQSELKKKDVLVLRKLRNGEIENVVFPNGLQAGLAKEGFNSGVKIPSTSTAPTDTEDRLYVINGQLYYDGSAVGGGGGGGAPTDAQYVVLSANGDLTDERVLVAGTGINITDGGAGGNVTVEATSPADPDAQYVVLAATGSLTSERVLTAGTGINIVDSGAGGNVTISATGGTTFNVWNPDAPPNTANALDDEFDSSLSGWTTWDAGSSGLTATSDSSYDKLFLNQPTIFGDQCAGIYKSAPTTGGNYEYSVWTKLNWISEDDTNFPSVFLFIAEDIATNPSTSAFETITLLREASQWRIHAQKWTNYANYLSATTYVYFQLHAYVRIRVSYDSGSGNTTRSFDWSSDGFSWRSIETRTDTKTFGQIGVGINNVGGPSQLYGVFDFFRVNDSSDFFTIPSGSLTQVTKA